MRQEKFKLGRSRKKRFTVRRYLWQIIRSYTARGSMASWGMPFEAIAAVMLLGQGKKKGSPKYKEE